MLHCILRQAPQEHCFASDRATSSDIPFRLPCVRYFEGWLFCHVFGPPLSILNDWLPVCCVLCLVLAFLELLSSDQLEAELGCSLGAQAAAAATRASSGSGTTHANRFPARTATTLVPTRIWEQKRCLLLRLRSGLPSTLISCSQKFAVGNRVLRPGGET